MPRSCNRSSTFRSESGKRMYSITARRMISGLVLKYLKEAGLVMGKSYATPLPRSTQVLLTRPYRALAKPNSAPSLASSTSDLERPCITKRQRRNLKLVLQRSVETTAQNGHSLRYARMAEMRTKCDFAAIAPTTAVRTLRSLRKSGTMVFGGLRLLKHCWLFSSLWNCANAHQISMLPVSVYQIPNT
ncbi:hypothetical protein RUM4293_01592 [Ruegeria atlantica]|uniref:Uncharacterized protein n=1 Tax=Ruegeria atlantica TaxID=81569 RepID=A0A0P1E3Y5_9RHOB|nr:hypothetical protein RUM4293_01592 [Ruegeria atlantica]